jgi:hypothetical protein
VLAKWKAAFERELNARQDEAERKLAAAQRLLADADANRVALEARLQAATAEVQILRRSHAKDTPRRESAVPVLPTTSAAAADLQDLQAANSRALADLRESQREAASLHARVESLLAQRDAAVAEAAEAAVAQETHSKSAAQVARDRDRALNDAKSERARADAAESELARMRHALAAHERTARSTADESLVTHKRWSEQAEKELAAVRADDAAKLAVVVAQRDKALADLRAADRRAGANANHQTDVAERLAVLDEQFAAWRLAANERESQLKQQLAVFVTGEAATSAQAQIDSLQRLVRDERRRAEALAEEVEQMQANENADAAAADASSVELLAQWRVKFENALADAADALERERHAGVAALERERHAGAVALERERQSSVAALQRERELATTAQRGVAAASAAPQEAAMQRLADNVEALQLRINAYRDELEFVAQERDAARREVLALRAAREQDSDVVDELESAREEQDSLRQQLTESERRAERVEVDARALLQQWREKFERELEWASQRGSQRPKRLISMLGTVQEQLRDAIAERDRSVELRKVAQRDAEQATAKHAAAASELAELAPQLATVRANLRNASERVAELERAVADADAGRNAAAQVAHNEAAEQVALLEASVSRLELDVEVRELRIGEMVEERELTAERAREMSETTQRLEEELEVARAAANSDVPRESERELASALESERAARRADAAEARALLEQWRNKFVDALQSHKDAVVMRQTVLKRLALEKEAKLEVEEQEKQADEVENVDVGGDENVANGVDHQPAPIDAFDEPEVVLAPLHMRLLSRIRSVLPVSSNNEEAEVNAEEDQQPKEEEVVEHAAKKRRRAKSASSSTRTTTRRQTRQQQTK